MPTYNCAAAVIPDHACDPCYENSEMGRVRHVMFLNDDAWEALKSAYASGTVPASIINSALAEGDAHWIGPVSGTFDGGAPITANGHGDIQERITGYTNTLAFNDPSYKANCGFYSALQKNSGLRVAFITETQIHISENHVSVRPQNPVTDSTTDLMQWVVNVIWQSKGITCPALLDESTESVEPVCAAEAGGGTGGGTEE